MPRTHRRRTTAVRSYFRYHHGPFSLIAMGIGAVLLILVLANL
ncbi:hypothetical protein [Actinokineospora inagensis]|nr:hypothetical protein [Actinokineospora inagensis]